MNPCIASTYCSWNCSWSFGSFSLAASSTVPPDPQFQLLLKPVWSPFRLRATEPHIQCLWAQHGTIDSIHCFSHMQACVPKAEVPISKDHQIHETRSNQNQLLPRTWLAIFGNNLPKIWQVITSQHYPALIHQDTLSLGRIASRHSERNMEIQQTSPRRTDTTYLSHYMPGPSRSGPFATMAV